ncbi:hypothetical protein BDM02DRAFT_2818990 [Thelephora ganbajun]|uniref:Uncharacterized protein n=1 Tax=Thelephora ganbajun TaxID=370292 RepID=A0ACB6YY10_THEGA|nr:hypothetical protein BDM02DRAFT_2818990 [Thelephora ganbajun]
MYTPLVKAFNYALDRFSRCQMPGLPKFQEDRQIVFARSDAKGIKSESHLQSSYKPDIVLVKWNVFKTAHQCTRVAYSKSYESDVCCESGSNKPSLSWRNLLSTIEVKRGSPGGAGNSGKNPSKGKAKENFKSTYTGDFEDLRGDLQAARPPEPSQSSSFRMVSEENPTRSLPTRSGLRDQGSSSSTPDRPPLQLQKRRRDLVESYGTTPKKPKSDSNTEPGGTSEQRAETPSEPGLKKSNEPGVEGPKRLQKQAPRVQSAIYASHKISSSFDISHTINLILIGT